jgi:hypothetical protein
MAFKLSENLSVKKSLEIAVATSSVYRQRPGQLSSISDHCKKIQHFFRNPRGTIVVSFGGLVCSGSEEEVENVKR